MTVNLENKICLAVDTSGRVGSVCLGRGSEILEERNFSGMMRHAAELFPTTLDILGHFNIDIDDISHIFVTAGPGSFTGLRIGLTMAKMMALAGDVKITTVSTLDAVAQNAIEHIEFNNLEIKRIAPIIDAKRNQFFVAAYEKHNNQWEKMITDSMMDVNTFISEFDTDQNSPIWLLGEGLKYYQKKFTSPGIQFLNEELWPAQSNKVYKLCYQKALKGEFEDPEQLTPNYLRLSDAEEAWQKKFGK